MTTETFRPEPGIATDEELSEAVSQLTDALDSRLYDDIRADRFQPVACGTDEWSEVIHVYLSDDVMATKETVLNDVLKSGAPVRVRDLENGRNKLTFYPTNQK